jgi:hypothetical protein
MIDAATLKAGDHFVEVLQMRALAEQGASWAYENFDFFVPARHLLEGLP